MQDAEPHRRGDQVEVLEGPCDLNRRQGKGNRGHGIGDRAAHGRVCREWRDSRGAGGDGDRQRPHRQGDRDEFEERDQPGRGSKEARCSCP